jgi:putative hydroxymethylpyrimidine transport system substrate-binding protein
MKKSTTIVYFLLAYFVFENASYSEKLQSVKIALEYFLNPHHAPIIVAIQNGYFKEENLQVSLYSASGSQEGCRQAASGGADFALTHEAQMLILGEKGLNLTPIAYLIPDTLEIILSRCPLDQIKGKVISHSSSGAGSLTFALIHQFLKSQNLSENDVTLILGKNALVQMFLAGKVDVVFNVYKTYQLYDVQKHNSNPYYVWPLKQFGIPAFASMVMVCGDHVPADVRLKMQRALQRAIDFIHASPDKTLDLLLTYKPELDSESNKAVWPMVKDVFSISIDPSAYAEQINKLKGFLQEQGILKKA